MSAAQSSPLAARGSDLLPLPTGAHLQELCAGASHGAWLRAAVTSLNEMGGRGSAGASLPSHAQALALGGLALDFQQIPECPLDVTARSAVSAVLGSDTGYVDDAAAGPHAPYRRGTVSLPRVHGGGVDLVDVLPPDARSLLEGSTGTLLLDADSQTSFSGKLAFDPLFEG